ncbi:DUF4282 domain-containing protein [Ruania suaedae]|uniref:DUF4282 domain-containing protein n=1 Tax=Ruania suaedae TaxID=2897774 RepID=UPI001E49CA5F|nr:DUF4282 domain-containing protein [Ruania suaedae]UFU02720.1 DUF4282 domain-containing protein [Ruania suaedae]
MSYTPPPPGQNEPNPAYGQQQPPPAGTPSYGSSSQQPPSYGSASQQPPAATPSYGGASQQPAYSDPGQQQGYGDAGQQPGYGDAGQQPGGPGYAPPGQPMPGYGGQPAAGYGPGYPQAGGSGGGSGNGFFSAFFDFSFSKYVTLTFAKVIFIIAIVIAILWYLGAIISGFGAGALSSMADPYGRNDGGGAILGVLAILFGWIPPVLFLIGVRIGLEFVVATIKTSQNTGVLAERD